jgi:hypothetical protein
MLPAYWPFIASIKNKNNPSRLFRPLVHTLKIKRMTNLSLIIEERAFIIRNFLVGRLLPYNKKNR